MEELFEHREFFIKKLEKFLNGLSATNFGEKELLEAIRYSLVSKTAKYIRSFLVLETAKMLQGGDFKEDVFRIAIAIEMIHCYSLIHDDLPSMDNSDFRRGEPSLHKKFPESTALLAGNSLLTLCFKVLSEIVNPVIAVKIIAKTADAVGVFGIMSGQVLDLNPTFKQNEFEVMNYHKTGKLIELSVILPAILFERSENEISILASYGRSLGRAYQMQDDLLDEGEESFSYLNKLGAEGLKKAISIEISECEKSISHFKNNDVLKKLPVLLSQRKF